MSQDHADHDHSALGVGHEVNQRRMGYAAVITGVFLIAEVIGGIVSGSLALLADAGHMAIDLVALVMAWVAFRLAKTPATHNRTYGLDRFQVLVAYTNGLALFAIAAWIIVEAIQRLQEPEPIIGGIMLAVAIAGIVGNLASFVLLHGADRKNLNVRAAALHVLGDLLGSVAAIVAAIVILTTEWTPIDPIASVVVAVIILRSAWRVVTAAGHILIEGTPEGIDIATIEKDLVDTIPGVDDVHHIHVWSITQERMMTTLHARIAQDQNPEEAVERIKARLNEAFHLDHATVEVEQTRCADAAAPAAPTPEKAK